MQRVAPLRKSESGFTYSEALIASTLLGPVLISALLTLDAMHAAYGRGERSTDLQQSARICMARIIRELRVAGLDPSGLIPGLPVQGPIQAAEMNRIAFVGDVNEDGNTEKIEYRLDLSSNPSVLRRQQWSTWAGSWSGTSGGQPLAEGIMAAEFSYFAADGRAIPEGELPARIAEIRTVGVVITAAAPNGQAPFQPYQLTSEVRLRNQGL
jgi:hypothetical protein